MTQLLRCVIVDDEPLAIEVLESYLEQFDNLQLVQKFHNPIKAFEFIRNNPVDVLFMDIQMPKLTGLDILRSLTRRPQVIITTAYRDYALEGFELEVVDYLLKPISLDRFVRAIAKIDSGQSQLPPSVQKLDDSSLFFRVDKKMVKVCLDEVLYLESQRDYLKIVLTNKEVTTHLSITEAEKVFPSDQFFRVHRSFIVAKAQIVSYSASEIEVGSHSIPIGRNYRAGVSKILDNLAGLKI